MSRLSDAGLLVPAFWERLGPVLKSLRGQGYAPVLFETMRSQERALELVAKGRSKARGGLSMHCFGVAADVICGDHRWDCRRHHCAFFDTYGVAVEDAGLCWGGRWPSLIDLPHCQAVPVRLQDKVRKCAPEHLDTLIRAVFAGQVQ